MSEYLKNWVMAQYISKFINVYDEEKENDIIKDILLNMDFDKKIRYLKSWIKDVGSKSEDISEFENNLYKEMITLNMCLMNEKLVLYSGKCNETNIYDVLEPAIENSEYGLVTQTQMNDFMEFSDIIDLISKYFGEFNTADFVSKYGTIENATENTLAITFCLGF